MENASTIDVPRVEKERSPRCETLSAIPSTLRIPLAARALGSALFPQVAVNDKHAANLLKALGDNGHQWLQDRPSVYGTLARTHCFRRLVEGFLEIQPDANVVNLGCGLADYFQWLDNDHIHMTDADLSEVMVLRRELLPSSHVRHTLREVDLNDDTWWDSLGLPYDKNEQPVFLFGEGVLMYLTPQTVQTLLRTFGERAPSGSLFAFDALCWLTTGRARRHPSVKHTAAEFLWGPRRSAELTQPHQRLHLAATHRVMEGYGLPYSLFFPAFRLLTGVPFYAIYLLRTEN